MAQIARPEAGKAADATKNTRNEIAELGKKITEQTAGQAENLARRGIQSARQAVDAGGERGEKLAEHAQAGATEVNQNLVQLITEQTKHNIQLFQALAQPSNWGKVAQLQKEFLRTSWQRAAQFSQRYVGVSQAAMSSALSTARNQAKKV